MFLHEINQVNYELTPKIFHSDINLIMSQLCANSNQAAMAYSYFRDHSLNATNQKMHIGSLCEPFDIKHIISKIEDDENAKSSSVRSSIVKSYIASLYDYVNNFSNFITEKTKLTSSCILSGLSSFCNYQLQRDTDNNTNEENKSLDIQTTTSESESLDIQTTTAADIQTTTAASESIDIQTIYDTMNHTENHILNDSSIFVLLDRNIFNLLRYDPEKCSVLLKNSNEEDLYNNIREIIPILDKYKDDENAVKLALKIMIEHCFSVKDGKIDLLSNISSSCDESSEDKLKKALFSSNKEHFKESCKNFVDTLFPFDEAIENLSYYNTSSFTKLINELAKLNVTDLVHFCIRKFYYKNCIDCQDPKSISITNLITQESTESCVEYLKAYDTFSNATLSDILQHTTTIIGTDNFSDGCTIKLNIPKELYYHCRELLRSIPMISPTPIDTTTFSLDTSVTDTYTSAKDASSESISTITIFPSTESDNVDSTTLKLSISAASILDNNTSLGDNYNTTNILSSFTSIAIPPGLKSSDTLGLFGLALCAVAGLGLFVVTVSIIEFHTEKRYGNSSHRSSSGAKYQLTIEPTDKNHGAQGAKSSESDNSHLLAIINEGDKKEGQTDITTQIIIEPKDKNYGAQEATCSNLLSHGSPSGATYLSLKDRELYATEDGKRAAEYTYTDNEAQKDTLDNITQKLYQIMNETNKARYSKFAASDIELHKLLYPNNNSENLQLNDPVSSIQQEAYWKVLSDINTPALTNPSGLVNQEMEPLLTEHSSHACLPDIVVDLFASLTNSKESIL